MGKSPEGKKQVCLYLDVSIAGQLRERAKRMDVQISSYANSALAAQLLNSSLEEWLDGAHDSLIIAPTLTEVLAGNKLAIWEEAIRKGLIARFVFLDPASEAFIHSLGEHLYFLDLARPRYGEEELKRSIMETVEIAHHLVPWSRSRDCQGTASFSTADYIPVNIMSRNRGEIIRFGAVSIRSPFNNENMVTLSRGGVSFEHFYNMAERIQISAAQITLRTSQILSRG